jgi:hypothetical protein
MSVRAGSSTKRRGGALLRIEVSDIHRYPTRPEGFEEPLFATEVSKRAVMEHLLEAPWLSRASDLEGRTGEAAHALKEPVELRNSGGRVELVRLGSGRRCSWRKRWVVEVLDRWREVGRWWDEDRHKDRLVFRAFLFGGLTVDLALERSGGWFLVSVVD